MSSTSSLPGKYQKFLAIYQQMGGGPNDWAQDFKYLAFVHKSGLKLSYDEIHVCQDLFELVHSIVTTLGPWFDKHVHPKVVQAHEVLGPLTYPGDVASVTAKSLKKTYWNPGANFAVVPRKLTQEMVEAIYDWWMDASYKTNSKVSPVALWEALLEVSPTPYGVDLDEYVGEYKKQVNELLAEREKLLGTITAMQQEKDLLHVAWQEALDRQQALQSLVEQGGTPQ